MDLAKYLSLHSKSILRLLNWIGREGEKSSLLNRLHFILLFSQVLLLKLQTLISQPLCIFIDHLAFVNYKIRYMQVIQTSKTKTNRFPKKLHSIRKQKVYQIIIFSLEISNKTDNPSVILVLWPSNSRRFNLFMS